MLHLSEGKKWLDGKDIAYTERNIAEENPTYEELKEWYEKSGSPLKSFLIQADFYKSMQLKEINYREWARRSKNFLQQTACL